MLFYKNQNKLTRLFTWVYSWTSLELPFFVLKVAIGPEIDRYESHIIHVPYIAEQRLRLSYNHSNWDNFNEGISITIQRKRTTLWQKRNKNNRQKNICKRIITQTTMNNQDELSAKKINHELRQGKVWIPEW